MQALNLAYPYPQLHVFQEHIPSYFRGISSGFQPPKFTQVSFYLSSIHIHQNRVRANGVDMSRAFSLSQLSPSSIPASPVRILTRSCPQDDAAPSSLEAEPLPASTLSTASQPLLPPPQLPATAENSAPLVAPEERPPTVNGVLHSHPRAGECPLGEGIHTCSNIYSNVNCKCGAVTDDGSRMIQCESCGAWSHLHCAGLTARSAKKATFQCHLCNPPLQKKSTLRAPNIKSSKSSKPSKKPSSSPAPSSTNPTHPSTSSTITPPTPVATEANPSSDAVPPPAPLVAYASKAEVDSLLQRVLDLEARLKTENKSLRMQVLALEEQNDHLKNEIDMLKSNMSTKTKPASSSTKGHHKGGQPKNSHLPCGSFPAPPPLKATPPSTCNVPTQGSNGGRQQDLHGPYQLKSIPGKRKVWGTLKLCSSTSVKSVITRLTSVGHADIRVKRKYKLGNGKKVAKWWHVVSGDEGIMTKLEQEWGMIQMQTSWSIESCMSYVDNTQAAPTSDDHSSDNSNETNANARNNGEFNNGNNDGSSVAPELSPNSDNNESTSTTNVNNGSHAITTPQLLSHQHQSPQPTAQTFLGNP